MKVLERIILPRVSDVGISLQELAKINSESHYFEFCIADFSDAFYTMSVAPAERANVVIKDSHNKYLCVTVCSFGLAVAPLLWGRLCAAIMRLSQSCLLDQEARAQRYVDDPVLVVAGATQQDRSRSFLA